MTTEKTKFSASLFQYLHLIHPIPLFVLLFLFVGYGCRPASNQEASLAPASGAALFKSKCAKCHDPELALRSYRSAEVWHETITRMKEKYQANISRREIGILVNYHVDRQKQEAAIFRDKCERCHPGRIFLEKELNAPQTRAIIKRMQQKAGNTIEDKDIEIIVSYHARAHQAVLAEDLKDIGGEKVNQPGIRLFAEKCSACHELDRALTVIKDPEVWARTIKRMQYYSKGGISDREVQRLVDFHVEEQQREIRAFKETCTQCHDEERINRRSLSEEQWLATIRRMQQKAPELITDEKVRILSAFFHRRELTMARIFYGKCQLCHYSTAGAPPFQGSSGEVEGVIVLGNEEFGDSFQIKDVRTLLSFHVQRQYRAMQFYSSNCQICHPEGLPGRNQAAAAGTGKRSRAEWISLIAALQGLELDREVQNMINSQIDYHISRQ